MQDLLGSHSPTTPPATPPMFEEDVPPSLPVTGEGDSCTQPTPEEREDMGAQEMPVTFHSLHKVEPVNFRLVCHLTSPPCD